MDTGTLRAEFASHWGGAPEVLATAPGRVNLIGEHTDYHDGYVFPAAIDLGIQIAARRTDGPTRFYSKQLGESHAFDATIVEPAAAPTLGWANFPAGMAWALRQHGFQAPNLEVYVDSTVPIGGGISSSAALEMALGVVWRQLTGADFDGKTMARMGRVAENGFVGKNSGIMDQAASALGKKGFAMFIDTRSLDVLYAPLPPGVELVICDTCVSHAGDDGSYNTARDQSFRAAELLGIKVLRDASMADLERIRPDLSDEEYRSAHHVIAENGRCMRFREALDLGDLASLRRLMQESHHSLQHDYRVSCTELDAMAMACWDAPGCLGARMTGGGFGGACVALVRSSDVPRFIEFVSEQYEQSTGIAPRLQKTSAAKGAHLLEP